MRWGVLWDFHKDIAEQWLDDFVDDVDKEFLKISTGYEEESWHYRSSYRSKLGRWSHNGLLKLNKSNIDGVITLFPPLGVITGLNNRFFNKRLKHVAWAFNLGHHPSGWQRKAAQFALSKVNRIVVHSTAEVDIICNLFNLSAEQVEFIHLQGPERPDLANEELNNPFVVAIGSANRDYKLLVDAMRQTKIRAKIVASKQALEGISPPENVELIVGATWEECLRLAQQARICVTPLYNPTIATGQVTIVDHLTMGRPIIATRCAGTVDYIQHGKTGLLVPPGDADALHQAIEKLWEDDNLRASLSIAARKFSINTLSDMAIGRRLGDLLSRIEQEPFR